MNLFFFLIFFLFYSDSFSQQVITVVAQPPEKKITNDVLKLPAKILANEKVQVTTVVSEKIKKIVFKEGKFVKKNQILIELFDDEEKAIKKQILAEVKEAKMNYERASKLFSKGNISQTILDNRLMLKDKLNARLEEINAKINDLKILAPFDGITGVKSFSEGSLVKPGDVITTLYDIKNLKIQAKVPEKFINKINDKTIFSLRSSIDNDINVKGNVSIIDPLIDDETRTFKIIGIINNPNSLLKPGLMVDLTFNFKDRESFFIRENAVFNQDNISYVYLVNKKNTVLKKKVNIGLRKDGLVEIIDGLSSFDLVVYEGINKIKEGTPVEIK
jgi:membrane fusion protein (multidrug efflux system)